MYETGLPDSDHENHLDICAREGILYVLPFYAFILCGNISLSMYGSFTVYPRPRSGRNLPAFKVKSILKGTEVDRE